jgi:zinc protease
MRRPFALAAIALLITMARPVRAQAPGDLPKAETVLDQYVEATGGKAAYEKLKNRTVSGTIEVAGANLKGTIKLSQAAPNRLVSVTDIEGVGQFIEGTDGKSAWKLSTVLGDRLLEGDEKETFLRRATFNDEIRWREVYDKVECAGIEDVDGKPAYKLVLTPKTGKPITKFYDKASHLLVKELLSDTSPMGEIQVESYPSDYKKVDGILVPFSLMQKAAGQAIELKMKEMKHNVDLPVDTFKRPAALDEPEKKKAA